MNPIISLESSGDVMGRQRRDVSSEDFMRLLERLGPDLESAWQKYDELRLKLVVYFESFGHHVEAEDLADESLNRIAKKPEDYPIDDLPILALGFARNIRRETLKKQAQTLHPTFNNAHAGKEPNPETIVISKIDRERRINCFASCLRGLMHHERLMILKYYPDEASNLEEIRSRLAETLGIEKGTLATKVARLRKILESCCSKCFRQRQNIS